MKKNNKGGVIILFVMAGVLGLSGLGIAYWYSNIRDVTPQYSRADEDLGCYWVPSDTTCGGLTGVRESIYSQVVESSTCPPIGYQVDSCVTKLDGNIACTEDDQIRSCSVDNYVPQGCLVGPYILSLQSDENRLLTYPLDRNAPISVATMISNEREVAEVELRIQTGGGVVVTDRFSMDECNDAVCEVIFTTVGAEPIIPKNLEDDSGRLVIKAVMFDSSGNVIDEHDNYCARSLPVRQPQCTVDMRLDSGYTGGTRRLEGIDVQVRNVYLDQFRVKFTTTDEDGNSTEVITDDISTESLEDLYYHFYLDENDLYSSGLLAPFAVPESLAAGETYAYNFEVSYLGEDGEYTSCADREITVSRVSEGEEEEEEEGEEEPADFSCTLNSVSPSTGVNSVQLDSATFTIENLSELNGDASFSFSVPEAGISGKRTNDFPITDISVSPYTLSLSSAMFANNTPLVITLPTGESSSRTYNVASQLTVDGVTVSCSGSQQVVLSPSGAVQPSETNITVSKSGGTCAERIAPRNRINFTINVGNSGTTREQISSITDKLPLGFTYVANSTQMSINGVAVTDGKEPTVNTVGSTQELIWDMSSRSGVDNGSSVVITFAALAGPQALTGENQNEVVVAIPNMPSDPNTLRTEYVFRVQQSCLSPQTGIFDSVMVRVLAGVILMVLGMLFMLQKGGYLSRYYDSRLFRGIDSIAGKAEMGALKLTDPKKYFEERIRNSDGE